jgi:hypothetical protein
LEEKKIALEKKKALNDLFAEENRTMMMDPSTMNEFTREWCNMRSLEIISRRKQARVAFSATTTGGGGGADGSSATTTGGGGSNGSSATTTGGIGGGVTSDDGLA